MNMKAYGALAARWVDLGRGRNYGWSRESFDDRKVHLVGIFDSMHTYKT